MIKRLSTILDECYLQFYGTGTGTGGPLSVSMVTEVLQKAVLQNVEELLVTKSEYEIILAHMVGSGVWDWDKKSFMGIKFTII